MAALEINMNTTAYIMETQDVPLQERRPYLGMSGIGGKCLRSLWYNFHWASQQEVIKIRTKRIFDRGDIEESRIISELVNCGFFVFRVDTVRNVPVPLTGDIGEEQEELTGFAKHAKGHPDGRIIGLPESEKETFLLEIKTAKASKFREFQKKGVYDANRVYYGQTQRYMDKMGLKNTLFVVTNKDTEERYYEFISLDSDYAHELERREQLIITSTEPPEKLSNNKNWMDCKWCKNKSVCHDNASPEKNCRTCEYADILDDGEWECDLQKVKLDYKAQVAGCKHWSKGWGL